MGKKNWGGSPGFGPRNWTTGAIHPHLDILEGKDGIRIYVELAGVAEQDIQISLQDGVLTVYGEKRPHNVEEWEQSRYLAERAFGTFRRSVNLPYGLDDDAADAEFGGGVLTINIPWAKEKPASSKSVPLKSH
jgi:HSP20 family protein